MKPNFEIKKVEAFIKFSMEEIKLEEEFEKRCDAEYGSYRFSEEAKIDFPEHCHWGRYGNEAYNMVFDLVKGSLNMLEEISKSETIREFLNNHTFTKRQGGFEGWKEEVIEDILKQERENRLKVCYQEGKQFMHLDNHYTTDQQCNFKYPNELEDKETPVWKAFDKTLGEFFSEGIPYWLWTEMGQNPKDKTWDMSDEYNELRAKYPSEAEWIAFCTGLRHEHEEDILFDYFNYSPIDETFAVYNDKKEIKFDIMEVNEQDHLHDFFVEQGLTHNNTLKDGEYKVYSSEFHTNEEIEPLLNLVLEETDNKSWMMSQRLIKLGNKLYRRIR